MRKGQVAFQSHIEAILAPREARKSIYKMWSDGTVMGVAQSVACTEGVGMPKLYP